MRSLVSGFPVVVYFRVPTKTQNYKHDKIERERTEKRQSLVRRGRTNYLEFGDRRRRLA